MATPTRHALCSASSSERWLNCTAAPRFEADFPAGTSSYTEEGRLAHSICEISAQMAFELITKRKYNAELKKLKADPLFSEEMLRTAEVYVQHLIEKSMTYDAAPYVAQEVKVDFSEYVPEGFGTCDCIMIGGNTLNITDYKHGKGVEVSAVNNSQMRLYALGAIKKYSMLYAVKTVSMAIVQPRITDVISEETITVDELMAWGESIKPLAMKAYSGMGDFKPGSWCRFCRGKAQCKARAENYTALEDFKELAGPTIPGSLTDAQIADLLFRGADLVSWYEDIKDYARDALLAGHMIPGWKVVAGKSDRVFTDADAALKAIRDAGFTEEQVMKPQEPKTLSQLEKLVGKKRFSELVGTFITKPMGKPTLAQSSDKRDPYNAAAADFAEVATQAKGEPG